MATILLHDVYGYLVKMLYCVFLIPVLILYLGVELMLCNVLLNYIKLLYSLSLSSSCKPSSQYIITVKSYKYFKINDLTCKLPPFPVKHTHIVLGVL